MDILTKAQRRRNMQAIKATGTGIEKTLRKALSKEGFRYRLNAKNVLGKPDFAFVREKVAVFCDSEFWHGKNWKKEKQRIKTNKKYWQDKEEKIGTAPYFLTQAGNIRGRLSVQIAAFPRGQLFLYQNSRQLRRTDFSSVFADRFRLRSQEFPDLMPERNQPLGVPMRIAGPAAPGDKAALKRLHQFHPAQRTL